MTWNDFYRRRDVIDSVLRAARHDPSAPLPFADIPSARDVFGSEEKLLLALHHKWTLLFGGHLRAELLDATDHVDAIVRAWRATVDANPVLRALLDAKNDHYPSLRSAHEAEQRMLAVAAGFAAPDEPMAEITRIGATTEALVRLGSSTRQRRDPISQSPRILARTH